jgi:hypothetical protein
MEIASDQWIYGFWSALNVVGINRHNVGQHTDPKGVVGEVRKECVENPSETLELATRKVYFKLDALGR